MAKSKKDLVAEYVALGGSREDFPADLDEVTAAIIEKKIEAFKLQAQLQGAEQEKQSPEAPVEEAAAAAEGPIAPAKVEEEKAGVLFTLTGASTFGSAALPNKRYDAGKPFRTEDEAEIAILRKSRLFKEGE